MSVYRTLQDHWSSGFAYAKSRLSHDTAQLKEPSFSVAMQISLSLSSCNISKTNFQIKDLFWYMYFFVFGYNLKFLLKNTVNQLILCYFCKEEKFTKINIRILYIALA